MDLDLLSTPFAIADLDGSLVDANAQFWRWTGAATKRGRLHDLISGLAATLGARSLEEALPPGSLLVVTDTAPSRRGRCMPVEYRLRRVEVDGGSHVSVEGADITSIVEKDILMESFSGIVETHSLALELQKRAIADLLDNIRQAIFAIDRHGQIVPPCSAFSSEVFGREVQGEHIFETVFSGIEKNSALAARIRSVLDFAFGQDELQWELLLENLPETVPYISSDDTEHCHEISYSPLFDEAGLLERILFVVDDVTAVHQLEDQVVAEREAQSRNLERLQELVANDREVISDFLANASLGVAAADDCCARLRTDPECIHELFRHLHTVKGNARLVRLEGMVSATHEAECFAQHIREQVNLEDDVSDGQLGDLRESIAAARGELMSYLKIAQRVMNVENHLQADMIADLHQKVLTLDASMARGTGGARRRARLLRQAADLLDQARSGGFEKMVQALTSTCEALEGTVGSPEETVKRCWATCLVAILEEVKHSRVCAPFDASTSTWQPLLVGLARLEAQIDSSEEGKVRASKLAARLTTRADLLGMAHMRSAFESLEMSLTLDDDENAHALLDMVWNELGFILALESHDLEADVQRDVAASLEGLLADGASPDLDQHPGSTLYAVARVLAPEGLARPMLERVTGSLEVPVTDILCPDARGHEAAVERLEQRLSSTAPLADIALEFLRSELPWCRAVGRLVTQSAQCQGSYARRCEVVRILRSRQSTRLRRTSQMPGMVPVVDTFLVDLETMLRRADNDSTALAEGARRLLEVPTGTLLGKLSPMVDDIAPRLGKSVKLRVEGQAVTAHRQVIDLLYYALLHMVRNSLDHGIEPPSQRQTLGKPTTGCIDLSFERRDARLRVVFQDDGNGIDPEAVAAHAVQKGMVTAEEVAVMSDHAKLHLIFRAGVSTAGKVKELSGRGVGLDVVAATVRKLGGDINVNTAAGRGVRFELDLPARRGLEAEPLAKAI